MAAAKKKTATKTSAHAATAPREKTPATAQDALDAATLIPSMNATPRAPSSKWIATLGAPAAQQAIQSVQAELAGRRGLKGLAKALADAVDVYPLVGIHERLQDSEQRVRQRIVAVETRLGPIMTALEKAAAASADDSAIATKLTGILSLRGKQLAVAKGRATRTKKKNKAAKKP